jgi:hypothetical protein
MKDKERTAMNFNSLKYLGVFILLLVLLARDNAVNASQASQKDGTLIVEVTWGDTGNTPANNVYAEAYGFVERYDSKKSFILKMSHAGQYEASLPPGVYDVFISDGGSVPRCRRLLIRPELTTYWTLKLETDDVYTNTSMQRRNK